VWIGHGKIVSARFLSGTKQIAIAWASGISLHAVDTEQELWFQPTPNNVIAFDVQPQAHGGAFAVALSDGSVMTFDAATGTPHQYQSATTNASWGDISWSPDGRTLAFQYMEPARSTAPISLLNVASGRIDPVPNSETADGVIPVLTWSPDGSSIYVPALGAEFPRFVDIRTGQERMRLAYPGDTVASAPIFLADGKTLAREGPNGTVELQSFPAGVKVKTLRSSSPLLGRWLTFFPDTGSLLFSDESGKWLAYRGGFEPCYCGGGDSIPSQYPLVVWDVARGVVRARLNLAMDGLKERHRLAAAFDGDRLMLLYESGEITRWAFTKPGAKETLVSRVPARLVNAPTFIWSADGNSVALASKPDGTNGNDGVEIYDTRGRLLQRFDPPLTAPALSPDGRLVALFNAEKNAEVIYDVQAKQLVKTLPAAPVLLSAAFSPDGRALAYAAKGGIAVAVYDIALGRVVSLDLARALPARAQPNVTRLLWSPDGQALVAAIDARESSPTAGVVSHGILVLWRREPNGTFTLLEHVSNAQASYDSRRTVLAAFDPSSRWAALQEITDAHSGQTPQVALKVYALKWGTSTFIHTFANYQIGVWLSDEDLWAVEWQYDSRLTRINVINGQALLFHSVDPGAIAFSPNGRYYARGDKTRAFDDQVISIREVESGAVAVQILFGSLSVVDFDWSPDGRWFAILGTDSTLRLWPLSAKP
jgi:WD40 repeat protein